MSVHLQLDVVQRQLAEIKQRLEGPSDANGVFVFGCPRSGTSVMSWALAAHPAFWTGPEANFLYSLAGPVRHAYERGTAHRDGWLRNFDVTHAEFAAAIGFGVHSLFSSRSRGKRWIDSSTENLLVAEELALMFPAARFVNVVRDGRAVVASLLDSGFGMPWTKDFATACNTWVDFINAGTKFLQSHPDRMLEVRNETMADEGDRIFSFLDEQPNYRYRELLKGKRINSSFSTDGELRPRSEKWHAWSEEEVAMFEEIAGPTMRQLGYGSSDG